MKIKQKCNNCKIFFTFEINFDDFADLYEQMLQNKLLELKREIRDSIKEKKREAKKEDG